MTASRGLPRVAVFDVDLPPGIAFVRSLGIRGVDVVAYGTTRRAAGMFSRHVAERRWCPPVYDSDEFLRWLVDEIPSGRFDLIALTSDYVAFNAVQAYEQLGRHGCEYPSSAAVRNCLFKDDFASAMKSANFPTPHTAAPGDLDTALAWAERFGYPVVLKPRSHIGVGVARGTVAHCPAELREQFVPYPINGWVNYSSRHHVDLGLPLVQQYLGGDEHSVISITGCMGPDGELLAVHYSKKIGGWPNRLGVGVRFDPVPPPPFAEAAISAVQEVLGSGIFELEVLVHEPTGQHWAIDLNPRGFGQLALDVAAGNDLPALWYESVTGHKLSGRRPRRRPVKYWHQGTLMYTTAVVRLVLGPSRFRFARQLFRDHRDPHVGSVADWRDPLPGLLFVWRFVRHPRALIRATMTGRTESAGDTQMPSPHHDHETRPSGAPGLPPVVPATDARR